MKTFFLFIFTIFSAHAYAEVPYVLEREFKICTQRSFSEKQFLRFYHVLDSLENASIDFSEFKNYKAYTSSINNLLNSTNYYQKGIAYRLVASLKDKEFNTLLLERMKMEDNKFLRTLNAAAIMKLMPTQTTVAFDYLVDCEDFASSPLLPVYLTMDEKSIIKTGYARLNDSRLRAKVFALQTIARFDTNPKVEELIIKSLKEWDLNIKGYAIVALSVYKRGHYKAILSPYLKETQLREVIIETLEKSAVEEDIVFAEQLKRKK
ncbi:MAG TPA: hypothetical protein PL009_05000 [Flavipsychrobacter sp.]|nr:hypothetical protein [Flavipsychrobacter sp.]